MGSMIFEIMVKIVLAGNSNSEVEVLGKIAFFFTGSKLSELFWGCQHLPKTEQQGCLNVYLKLENARFAGIF